MLIDLTHREIPLECWANWRRDGGVRTLSQLGWMPSPTDTWTSSNAGLSVFYRQPAILSNSLNELLKQGVSDN